MESLQYSSYLEYCCHTLTEANEYESDLVLASLVRMQYILEPINRSFAATTIADEVKAPVWMIVKSARAELQRFWGSLPVQIQQNRGYTRYAYCELQY